MKSKSRRRSAARPERILFSEEAATVAREVLEEVGGEDVGEALGVSVPTGPRTSGEVAVHRYRCLTPGYRDWEWKAVLATVPGSGEITVSEVSLQAGEKAALAPEWVPYEDRVLPGDLGPGDTLPPRPDDERLAAWSELTGDTPDFPRNPHAARALSDVGLTQALDRWRLGDFGPGSEFAELAEMDCRSCAFYLPMNSPETHFGACTNEFSADGRVVHESYGCGAHSETQEEHLGLGRRSYGAFDDGF